MFKKHENMISDNFWEPEKVPFGLKINFPGARGGTLGTSFGTRGTKKDLRKSDVVEKVEVGKTYDLQCQTHFLGVLKIIDFSRFADRGKTCFGGLLGSIGSRFGSEKLIPWAKLVPQKIPFRALGTKN